MTIKLDEGENLITERFANLFKGIEAVGGRMKVTDKRIIFEPHPINIQRGDVEIPLSEITEVRERSTLGIVPNGISIITKSREEYKFVVWNRKELIEIIKNAISNLRQLPAGVAP